MCANEFGKNPPTIKNNGQRLVERTSPWQNGNFEHRGSSSLVGANGSDYRLSVLELLVIAVASIRMSFGQFPQRKNQHEHDLNEHRVGKPRDGTKRILTSLGNDGKLTAVGRLSATHRVQMCAMMGCDVTTSHDFGMICLDQLGSVHILDVGRYGFWTQSHTTIIMMLDISQQQRQISHLSG